MKKGTIVGLTNDDTVAWYRLRANMQTVEHIDALARTMDTHYHEGFLKDKRRISYKKFVPQRFSHSDGDKFYAISIFHDDFIDFIVFKSHPVFDRVQNLIHRFFTFATGLTKNQLSDNRKI